MSKQQFMAELKQLLGELPVAERDEALNYYEDYFADAGEENEEAIIEELGSPEKVAFTIKTGLADSDKEIGEFTESGFKGYESSNKDEIINTIPEGRDRGISQRNSDNRYKLILIILVLLVTLPVTLPILGTAFGLAVAAIATMFALIVAFAAAGIGCTVAGAICLVVALAGLAVKPMGAMVIGGLALALLGIGSLLTTLGFKIISKAIPKACNVCITIVKKLIAAVNRRRGYLS